MYFHSVVLLVAVSTSMHRTKKRRGRARLPGETSSFHDGQARLSSQTLTKRQLLPLRERRRSRLVPFEVCDIRDTALAPDTGLDK